MGMAGRSLAPLSVVIVGTGGIAQAHARACREVEGVDLAAACDVSRDAVERFGNAWSLPPDRRFVDVEAMVESVRPDIAIIATWGIAHASTGITVARTGKVRAILCEKPFTMNAAEAVALVDACREAGVRVAEAFKFRHHPAHLAMRARIDAGAIGEVRMIRNAFCQSIDAAQRHPDANWRWDRARGGGSIYDLACYGIHHARYVARAEPFRVYSSARLARADSGVDDRGVDFGATISLTFPGDVLATIVVAHDSWHAHDAEVAGTRGILRLENPWNNEDREVVLVEKTRDAETRTTFAPTFQFADQLRHLASCVREGTPHRIPPEDSIAQMRVIDATFASIASGVPVDINSEEGHRQ
jgi:xylose dehydrogenase (NAD/NADP)